MKHNFGRIIMGVIPKAYTVW